MLDGPCCAVALMFCGDFIERSEDFAKKDSEKYKWK